MSGDDLFGAAAPAQKRRRIHAAGVGPQSIEREQNDYYPTHPVATHALLAVEPFTGTIWEPAAGCGAMSRVLAAAGLDVRSTDLIDRGFCPGGLDFLAIGPSTFDQHRADNIITNPPFRFAAAFVDQALRLARRKVAMFLRLKFLEGVERGAWLPATPLARVHVMSRRVPIQRGRIANADEGHGAMSYAWYIWEHGHTGAPSLNFVDWNDYASR